MSHPYKDTISFDEAIRKSYGPLAFNLMIKPAGSLCNLSCRYCYYLDKAEIYGRKQPRMTLEMLEKLTKDYIAANDTSEVTFNWHGGEPLVMGLEFYRKAVEFQNKYADGKIIRNTLQTNGTLITEEYSDFFSSNKFLIGISIDGPEEIHDRHRIDKGGHPTFDKVMNGLLSLRQRGVEFNTMTAVSNASEGKGLEVYQFLKHIGSRYMQFMPVVEHVKNAVIVDPGEPGASLAPWSVSAEGFGRFMCDMFDCWVRNDVGQCFVNLFDAALAGYCGVQSGICAYASTCGGNTVVEHNGDVYPCDHFVYPKYLIGNINDRPLREIVESEQQFRFGLEKRNALPAACFSCKYAHLCHGECPKHRFNNTENGDAGLSALCEGYKMYYSHTAPYMLQMKELLLNHRPPSDIMHRTRTLTDI